MADCPLMARPNVNTAGARPVRCPDSSDGASMEIFLESRKNDQYRQGSHILVSAINSYACPVGLTTLLMGHAGLADGDRPLFSAVSVHEGQEVYGSTTISYQSLRKGVLEVFREVGLPAQKFGLHSLRAGGATLAANSGVSDRLWMEHGGWRSFRSAVGYVKTSPRSRPASPRPCSAPPDLCCTVRCPDSYDHSV